MRTARAGHAIVGRPLACLGPVLVVCALAGCAPREHRFIDRLPDVIVHTQPIAEPVPLPALPTAGRFTVYPGPAWIPPGGIQNRWECIVIHHSANDRDTPAGIDAFHRRRGWDEMGYHFVIGNGVGYPDGQVFVGPRWICQKHGAHCKVPGNYYNDHGIGICLVGNFEHTRPTDAQMQSLAALCRFLCEECRIPESQVLTHVGVTGRTECPGRNFSMAELHRRLGHATLASSTR